MTDEWPKLCEPQTAGGNGSPTFDPSAPAVLWVMAADRQSQWLTPAWRDHADFRDFGRTGARSLWSDEERPHCDHRS